MSTATASPPIEPIKRRRELTETDYRVLMELFGCEVSTEIPQNVVEACLTRQAKWHAVATGPLPEKEIKAAMAECGFHTAGKLLQRAPTPEPEVPVNDDHDDLKGEMDLGGSLDLTGPKSPAAQVEEAVQTETDQEQKAPNPWKGVEKGTIVVCETKDGFKRGRFAGLGAGGHPTVTIIGDSKPTLITGKIEVQEVPKEEE